MSSSRFHPVHDKMAINPDRNTGFFKIQHVASGKTYKFSYAIRSDAEIVREKIAQDWHPRHLDFQFIKNADNCLMQNSPEVYVEKLSACSQ